jgi:hypothetical protein
MGVFCDTDKRKLCFSLLHFSFTFYSLTPSVNYAKSAYLCVILTIPVYSPHSKRQLYLNTTIPPAAHHLALPPPPPPNKQIRIITGKYFKKRQIIFLLKVLQEKSCCGSASGTGWIRIRILMDPHPDLDGSALFWKLDPHPDLYQHKIKIRIGIRKYIKVINWIRDRIRINF